MDTQSERTNRPSPQSEVLEAVDPSRGRSALFRVFEWLFMASWFVEITWLIWRLWPNVADRWAATVAALALALLSMDWLTGMLHWAGDTWGSVHWPLIGQSVIRTFREHHVDEKAITRHDFLEVNATSVAIGVPVLAFGHWVGPDHHFAATWCVGMGLSGLVANQFHLWAHRDDNAWWIRALQRSGLILSPEGHALHHRAPYTDHYCITTGWLNYPLAKIRYFRALEWIISKLTGAVPRAEDVRAAEALAVAQAEALAETEAEKRRAAAEVSP